MTLRALKVKYHFADIKILSAFNVESQLIVSCSVRSTLAIQKKRPCLWNFSPASVLLVRTEVYNIASSSIKCNHTPNWDCIERGLTLVLPRCDGVFRAIYTMKLIPTWTIRGHVLIFPRVRSTAVGNSVTHGLSNHTRVSLHPHLTKTSTPDKFRVSIRYKALEMKLKYNN